MFYYSKINLIAIPISAALILTISVILALILKGKDEKFKMILLQFAFQQYPFYGTVEIKHRASVLYHCYVFDWCRWRLRVLRDFYAFSKFCL